MTRCDDSLLGLVLDTGHSTYGGGDPVALLEKHARRIWHVHFKDCDPRVAGQARADEVGYLAAVRRQLFCELGQGAVDFPAVLAALERASYDGWIVVEQDVFPGYGTPLESAKRNRAFLRGSACDVGETRFHRFRRFKDQHRFHRFTQPRTRRGRSHTEIEGVSSVLRESALAPESVESAKSGRF